MIETEELLSIKEASDWATEYLREKGTDLFLPNLVSIRQYKEVYEQFRTTNFLVLQSES